MLISLSLFLSRLTSGSIGSEEDFNMANGDASSSDSAPSVTNRPALQQFRKQKEQAAVEGMGHVILVKRTLSILFPEPTCLLVSTKTRSSGIINFPRTRF